MGNKVRAPRVKRIRKPMGLSSIPGIDGRRRREEERVPVYATSGGRNTQFDLTDDQQAYLANLLKDDRLAARIRKLQDKYVNGGVNYATVPELIFMDFLDRKGERYIYQVELFGGKRTGGLVPDFVIPRGGTSLAFLINGSYWHNLADKPQRDYADKLRMKGTYYEGTVIRDVIIIWENKLLGPDRERVMELALFGQEVGE